MTAKFDDAYYARLARGVWAVIDGASGLAPAEFELLAELVNANEPGVALEMLGEFLAERGGQISEAAANLAIDLAGEMGLTECADGFRPLQRSQQIDRPEQPPMTAPIPDILSAPSAPWLFELNGTASNAYELANKAASAGITARVVRGWKMRQTQGLYDEFAAAWQFPSYFGENGPAFDECLADMEWTPGIAYVVVVAQADALLADEPSVELESCVRRFVRASEAWATPTEAGEWWDRPAVPFHFVFQAETAVRETFRQRFEAAGAELQAF
jgi:hypothetical protein